MPITADQMSYDDMVRTAKTERCGKCGGHLGIAWVNGGYVLRCSDLSHNTITRHDKEYEKRKLEVFSMDSKSLMVMTEAKMIERVNMAKFPQDLTPQERRLLAQAAITYGFDPLMNELTIYDGRVFVEIDGRYRKAQETGKLDGVETRPATKQEKEDWEIPEGDYFYRSEVSVKGASKPFVGWGRVRASETKPGSRRQGDTTSTYKPIQNNPQRMAEKRAEAQALRKAFHIPLPSAEDIGGPDFEPRMTVTVEPQTNVDRKTGEITEAPPTEQPEDLWEDAKKEPAPAPVATDEIKALQALAKSKGHTEDTWKALIWQECALGTMKGITRENLAKLQEALNKQPVKI